MKFLLTLLLVFSSSSVAFARQHHDPNQPDPRVDVTHYVFNLTLSDASDEINGNAEITARFRTSGVKQLRLDLASAKNEHGMTVESVRAGESRMVFHHSDDRLAIKLSSPSQEGETKTFTIDYHGVPADGLIISTNKHGDRTFFGDNWPNRAHQWLPTVDHPADKALCDFVVTAPDHYQVIGNGEIVEETDLDGDRRLTHWRSTVDLATKVMVIGAARFAVQYVGEISGTPVESWVYPQDRDAGFYDYALAERILAFFVEHIGPFPYAKLANVQSKTRYGGMENASNIFYNESSVSGNRQSEALLAHEIAHQWFGDSVTEDDWHHIWLSEGFATYFTQLYLEAIYGRDRLVAGMAAARKRVLAFYQKNPNLSIVDSTITDLNALLSPNSYQKGAWVLHMLRHQIGDEAFWKGIRGYYAQYRDGNALSRDFESAMESASGKKLNWFFREWLSRPGQLNLKGHWRYDKRKKRLVVEIRQVGDPYRMPVELGIYGEKEEPRIEIMALDGTTNTYTFPMDAKPSHVDLDPNGWVLMQSEWNEQ